MPRDTNTSQESSDFMGFLVSIFMVVAVIVSMCAALIDREAKIRDLHTRLERCEQR